MARTSKMILEGIDVAKVRQINQDLSSLLGQSPVNLTTLINALNEIHRSSSDMLRIDLSKVIDAEQIGAIEDMGSELRVELIKYVKNKEQIDKLWREMEFLPYVKAGDELVSCDPKEFEAKLNAFKLRYDQLTRPKTSDDLVSLYHRCIQEMSQHLRNAMLNPQNKSKDIARAKAYQDKANLFLSVFKEKIGGKVKKAQTYFDVEYSRGLLDGMTKMIGGVKLEYDPTEGLSTSHIKKAFTRALNESTEINTLIDKISERAVSYYDLIMTELMLGANERLDPNQLTHLPHGEPGAWPEASRVLENGDDRLSYFNHEITSSSTFYEHAIRDNLDVIKIALTGLVPNQADYQLEERLFVSTKNEVMCQLIKDKLSDTLLAAGIKCLTKAQEGLSKAKVLKAEDLVEFTQLLLLIKGDLDKKLDQVNTLYTPNKDAVELIGIPETQDTGPRARVMNEYSRITKYIENSTLDMYTNTQEKLADLLRDLARDKKVKSEEIDQLNQTLLTLRSSPAFSLSADNQKLSAHCTELIKMMVAKLFLAAGGSTTLQESFKNTASACEYYAVIKKIDMIKKPNFMIDTESASAIKGKLYQLMANVLNADEVSDDDFRTVTQMIMQLGQSGLLASGDAKSIENDFTNMIISKKKVVQCMGIIKQHDLSGQLAPLEAYCADVMGRQTLMSIPLAATSEEIRRLMNENTNKNLKNNLLISLPSDQSLLSSVLDVVNEAMASNPFLIVFLNVMEDAQAQKTGVLSKIKTGALEKTNTPKQKRLETMNLEHLKLLERIETALDKELLPVSRFVEQITAESKTLSISTIKNLGTIYFQRALMKSKDLSAEAIMNFVLEGERSTPDEQVFERLKFLAESSNENAHQVLLKVAQKYQTQNNKAFAIRYLELIPPESKYYAEALRSLLTLHTDHDKLNAAAENLLVRQGAGFGKEDNNLKPVLEAANKIMATGGDVSPIANALSLVHADAALNTVFSDMLRSKNPAYIDHCHKIVVQHPDFLKGEAKTKYLDLLLNLTGNELKNFDKPALNKQMHLLLESAGDAEGLFQALSLRLDELEGFGDLDQDLILDLMRHCFQADSLDAQHLTMFHAVLTHLGPISFEWDANENEGNIQELIKGCLLLAQNNPQYSAEILRDLVVALPLSLNIAMRENNDQTYLMVKPIRDAVRRLPEGNGIREELTHEYPALRKKNEAERLFFKVRLKHVQNIQLIRNNVAVNFARSLVLKITKRRPSAPIEEYDFPDSGSDASSSHTPDQSAHSIDLIGSTQGSIRSLLSKIPEQMIVTKSIREIMTSAQTKLVKLKDLQHQLRSLETTVLPQLTKENQNELRPSFKIAEDAINEKLMTACKGQLEAIRLYFIVKITEHSRDYREAIIKYDPKNRFTVNQKRASNTLEMLNNLLTMDPGSFRSFFNTWSQMDLSKDASSASSSVAVLTQPFSFLRRNIEQSDHVYYQSTLDCEVLLMMKDSPEGRKTIQNTIKTLEHATKAEINNSKSMSEAFTEDLHETGKNIIKFK